jgi:hypothetical protein
MTKQEKDKLDEIKHLRERCVLLESLLGEAIRYGYIDENTCSPSWLKESRKVVGEPER